MGPLEYVLNTPSHHRVHHGRYTLLVGLYTTGRYALLVGLYTTGRSIHYW